MLDTKKYETLLSLLDRINRMVQRNAPSEEKNNCCAHCRLRFDPMLDRVEAGAYMGFQPHTLALWDSRKTHNLQPIKYDNAVRYRLSSLNEFADRRIRPF